MSSKYFKETFLNKEIKIDKIIDSIMEDEIVEEADEIMDKQVLIRVSEKQRNQWQEAAQADGSSVSDWLRQMADTRYREIFECLHPLEMRKSYPWSEFCNKCGARLR